MGKVSGGGARDRASDRPPNVLSLHRSGSLPRSDWTPSVTSVYLACAWKSISGWCQNRQVSGFESKARAFPADQLGRSALCAGRKLLNRINLICPTGGQAIFLSSPFCKNISFRA